MFFVGLWYFRAFSHDQYKRDPNKVAAVPVITFLLRVFNLTDLLWDTTSTIQGLCDKPSNGNEQGAEVNYYEAKGLLPSHDLNYRSGDESSDPEYERLKASGMDPQVHVGGVVVAPTYNGNLSDDVPLVDKAAD